MSSEAPPPYTPSEKGTSKYSQTTRPAIPEPNPPSIRRKPLASQASVGQAPDSKYAPASPSRPLFPDATPQHASREKDIAALDHTFSEPAPSDSILRSPTEFQAQALPGHAQTFPITAAPGQSGPSRGTVARQATMSALKTGFEEARHFAGGLMHHPVESTKHFSVLRHSHGTVYYQGPKTSIAVSIFSDAPLPAGRTLWLQSKGWTGHTGLKMKALVRSNGDWINVTPANKVSAQQLPPNDERAWQRDISKFLRKAEGSAAKHKIRETAIVRIPVDAQDGYWRIVLCDEKKKMLCPSPVFRVASASTSPSSIRGASLGNLPLEIGASVLSSVATGQVQTIVQPITSSVTSAIQSAIPYQPGFVAQEAGTMAVGEAYTRTGAQERVDAANTAYDAARNAMYEAVPGSDSASDGPQAPYPIKFSGRIAAGTGAAMSTTGMPTANLRSISDDIAHRLSVGYYFGWARLSFDPKQHAEHLQTAEHRAWQQSVISILPNTQKAASVVADLKKVAAVYLIHDFEGATFVGANIEIRVLGQIRPYVAPSIDHTGERGYEEPDPEDALLAAVEDVAFTQGMLERTGWGPDATPMAGMKRSLTDRYVGSREQVMRQVDRVPSHKVGVRLARDELKDKAVGIGGVYVVRDPDADKGVSTMSTLFGKLLE